jgi:hypothetical protein
MCLQQSWETESVVAREVAQDGDILMKNAGETAGVRSSSTRALYDPRSPRSRNLCKDLVPKGAGRLRRRKHGGRSIHATQSGIHKH